MIPYLPLIYLINKWLFNNLRFTEIVVFSTIFYFQEEKLKFKNYQVYFLYLLFYFCIPTQIINVNGFNNFVFLYLNQRISKKEIYTILLSILIVLPLVYSSFSPNIFGLNEVSEDISEAFHLLPIVQNILKTIRDLI